MHLALRPDGVLPVLISSANEAMIQRAQIAGFAAILITATTWGVYRCNAPQPSPASPLVFYGAQSGASTFDQGEGGGNPFASALIELLKRPSLTYSELHFGLIDLTKKKSRGLQVPDAPALDATEWRLRPAFGSARRIAMVLVYSDYSGAKVASLPGAKRDLKRMHHALQEAGFEVQEVLDPTRAKLRAALDTFSRRSKDADAAVIYLTGHGFEHRGAVYLAPNDYPFHEGPNRLSELAVNVPKLGALMGAQEANLVFFGGCRAPMR